MISHLEGKEVSEFKDFAEGKQGKKKSSLEQMMESLDENSEDTDYENLGFFDPRAGSLGVRIYSGDTGIYNFH